jgi:hypothetical protein
LAWATLWKETIYMVKYRFVLGFQQGKMNREMVI